ncbi:MAG TPA: hypothetical protein DEO38_04670 [Bacteroidales bacterium]|nr:hypothetical protein [Bacteroidales bacterium]
MDIVESNMLLPFDDQNAYRIERANIVQEKKDIKVCEYFALIDGRMLLIEAKSSSPRPGNKIKFDEYIDEISQKFIDTLLLFNALRIGRHGDEEKSKLPANILNVSLADVQYAMYLIVHGNDIEWMEPIQEALKLKLKHCLKSWNIQDINVYAINHETAKEKGLIKEYIPLEILDSFKQKGLKSEKLKREVENWFKENSAYGKTQ